MTNATDRELLKLAAKAIGGLGGYRWSDEFRAMVKPISGSHDGVWSEVVNTWNPLTDDRDALRLAVKLNIDIGFNRADDEQTVQAIWPDPADPHAGGTFTESFEPDKCASTRRAIVRAAALIGECMS